MGCRGREHFVTICDEQQDVGANASEGVCNPEGCDANSLCHADVGVGIEQAFDFYDPCGGNLRSDVTECWGVMRAYRNDVQIHARVTRKIVQ